MKLPAADLVIHPPLHADSPCNVLDADRDKNRKQAVTSVETSTCCHSVVVLELCSLIMQYNKALAWPSITE